ncbi:TPA: IS630 family transposase, partial [Streptococcus pneumoniae]|nr:IS630 family transposase [Streptococcus pneumoniae]
LSQAYPDDYILLVMDNAIWHKSSALKIPKRGFKNKAFRTLEDVIQGLEKEMIKSIVNRRWTRMLCEDR